MDMKVTRVVKDTKDTKADRIPYPLPSGDTRILFVAPSYTGKTNTIVWMLKQKEIYDYYGIENIYLFSPTCMDLDPTWSVVKLGMQNVHDDYSTEKLVKIVEKYMEINKERAKDNKSKIKFLVILDDCVDLLPNGVWDNTLKSLIFKLRHYGGSIWISSQSYKSVPKPIRLNTTHRLLFQMNNLDLQDVAGEVKMPKKDFFEVYDYATESDPGETWHFLYIRDKESRDERLFKDFTEKIIVD